jgi:hypothetical protein
MSRRAIPAIALVATTLLGSAWARAQSDPAAAMELFRQGREAIKAGDYAQACPKFADSLRLDEKVGTALNLAQCEEHQGQLATARAHAQRAIDLALATHDDRLALAQELFASLDRRVPRLTVVLAPGVPPDTVVKRDEVLLGVGSLGSALPVNPGAHVIVVSASGFEPRTFTVNLTEGNGARVEVSPGPKLPERVTEPPAPPMPATPQLTTPTPATDAVSSSPSSSLHTWGWVAGGVGIAGIAAGSVLGLAAIAKNNQSHQTCNADNVCDPTGADERNTARTLGDASTAAFVVGAAGVAGGLVLLLISPAPSAPTKGVTVTPLVGAGAAGVVLGGGF